MQISIINYRHVVAARVFHSNVPGQVKSSFGEFL